MEFQDEMVEMDSQEGKGREETLVCRDHLALKVYDKLVLLVHGYKW